jgi:hypothetical protein
MNKLDLTKKYKECYRAKTEPTMVEIQHAGYVAVRGKGDPAGIEYGEHIAALFSVAYSIKFAAKSKGLDFAVPKLEGQWWFDEDIYAGIKIDEAPKKVPREEWEYRMLIRMPDIVDAKDVEQAVSEVMKKKKPSGLQNVDFYEMGKSLCVQMLHLGPFETEPVTLNVMQAFMQANALERNGLHHEVYLSDIRRTPAGKLRTILREPVRMAGI